jgi:hypothetical protein
VIRKMARKRHKYTTLWATIIQSVLYLSSFNEKWIFLAQSLNRLLQRVPERFYCIILDLREQLLEKNIAADNNISY